MIYTSDLSPDGRILAIAGYPVLSDERDENYIVLIDIKKGEQIVPL